MQRKMRAMILIMAMLIGICPVLPARNVEAASATHYTLISNSSHASSGRWSKYDVNGDGRKDTIKVSVKDLRLVIYLNGQRVASSAKGEEDHLYFRALDLIRLKNGKWFLYAHYITGVNSDGYGVIYRIRGNKLAKNVTVPNYSGGRYLVESRVKSVKGNTITIYSWYLSDMVGSVYSNMTYTCQKGKMVSKTGSGKVTGVNYENNTKLTTTRSLTLYTGRACKKSKGTVASGKSCTFKKICAKNGNMYIVTSSGKKGWIKYENSPAFSGVELWG